MTGINSKFRKLFLFMGIAMIFLIAVVFLFNPNKTFSQFTDGEYVIGEERYSLTLSSTISGVPENISSMFSAENLEDKWAETYVNYQDKDGNSFDPEGVEYLEYSCGESDVCVLWSNDDSWEEKIGSDVWYVELGSSLPEGIVVFPTSFTYEGVEYKLNHYYASYSNELEYVFCRPKVTLNGNNYNTRIVYGRYYSSHFSDFINPSDDLSDEINFDWEYYESSVKLINNVVGEGADFSKSFNYELYPDYSFPDGKYGDVVFSDGYSEFSLRNGESVNIVIPGNYMFYVYCDEFGYITSNSVNSSIIQNVYDQYETGFLLKDVSGGEITYTHVFTAAKPLIIKNTVEGNVDSNKKFGFTITLGDDSINGVYSGVTFTNGVGRVHLRNGGSISILLPDSGISYSIHPTNYSDYQYTNPSNYKGNISSDSSITVEYKYTYNSTGATTLDGYYSGTVVSLNELIPGKSYVIFRATGGKGYMFTGKGNAKEITSYSSYSGGKVRWPDSGDAYSNVLWTYTGTPDKALFESFGAVNTYMTVGKSTSGKNPVGNEISYVKLETTSSPAIRVSNDGYYLALNSSKDKYTSSTSANSLYFAEIDEQLFNVSFNGSNDGLHMYDGAVDKDYQVIEGNTIVAPTTDNVKMPSKYNYELKSWIELTTGMEIEPGEEFTVNGDYKFYANWVPKSYDIGVNKDVVSNLDTSSFIKTEVFDYSELYNLYSTSYANNRWSLLGNGQNVYFNSSTSPIVSRGVVFFDNTMNSKKGLLNSVDNRDSYSSSKQVNNGANYYDGIVTKGISSYVINDLFDKDSNLYGVNYVGSDKYLYQFDEESGYYYYDSTKNAASYNKSDERFYVYDYTYGTSKSYKDGENKSDFLPFNYMSKKDAEAGKSLSASNGSTNYWFGLKSEISFDLIDDVGVMDSNGEYGNKDVNGNDMILKFSGDDDVWVFVDDKLVLDLGGVHDIVYGEINFSTGVVTVAQNGAGINTDATFGFGYSDVDVADSKKIQQTKLTDISAGNHKVTFYYVERGASQSNVSLYFNITEGYTDPGDIIILRDEESYASLEKHEFTITLSDNRINGYYGEADFVSGVALFKLAGGERLTISGLPAGLSYTVSVKAPKAHTTKFTSNGKVYTTRTILGRVIGGNISRVEYVNNYSEYSSDSDDEVVPETSDNTIMYIALLIGSLVVVIIIIVIRSIKKNSRK